MTKKTAFNPDLIIVFMQNNECSCKVKVGWFRLACQQSGACFLRLDGLPCVHVYGRTSQILYIQSRKM